MQQEGIISYSHLSEIENAEINELAVMLYLLAMRFGKDMSYFLG